MTVEQIAAIIRHAQATELRHEWAEKDAREIKKAMEQEVER